MQKKKQTGTWCSWHARKFGQVLCLPDHDLDAVGHRLVLEQDKQLTQSPRATHRHPPTTQGLLGAHTLKKTGGEDKDDYVITINNTINAKIKIILNRYNKCNMYLLVLLCGSIILIAVF